MGLLFEEETFRILGACFEVYKEKGSGFLESVYQECLEMEFELQGILFVPQSELGLSYKGKPLKQKYKPDFIVFDKVIVEIRFSGGMWPNSPEFGVERNPNLWRIRIRLHH